MKFTSWKESKKLAGVCDADVLASVQFQATEDWQILKYRMQGLSCNEIGKLMNMSPSTVNSREWRALMLCTEKRHHNTTCAARIILEVRKREHERGAAWLGTLVYFQEVTQ